MSVITDPAKIKYFGSIRLEDTGYVFTDVTTSFIDSSVAMLASHGWEFVAVPTAQLDIVKYAVRPFPRRSTLTPPGFPADALLTEPDIAADWWYEHDAPEKAERVRLRQWIPDRDMTLQSVPRHPLGQLRVELSDGWFYTTIANSRHLHTRRAKLLRGEYKPFLDFPHLFPGQ